MGAALLCLPLASCSGDAAQDNSPAFDTVRNSATDNAPDDTETVSYTHLTLPTSDLV